MADTNIPFLTIGDLALTYKLFAPFGLFIFAVFGAVGGHKIAVAADSKVIEWIGTIVAFLSIGGAFVGCILWGML